MYLLFYLSACLHVHKMKHQNSSQRKDKLRLYGTVGLYMFLLSFTIFSEALEVDREPNCLFAACFLDWKVIYNSTIKKALKNFS